MKANTQRATDGADLPFDAGPATLVALATATGMDLLLAEMRALTSILPGHPGEKTPVTTPGEADFDDLPV